MVRASGKELEKAKIAATAAGWRVMAPAGSLAERRDQAGAQVKARSWESQLSVDGQTAAVKESPLDFSPHRLSLRPVNESLNRE